MASIYKMRSFNHANWILLILGFSLLTASFYGGVEELFVRWDKQEEYSHGYMLPLLTLYFIWQKKQAIQQADFEASWCGLLLVLVALLFAVIGEVSALYLLIHYGFIAVLIGAAWAIMGWPSLKLVFLPLMLLVFAVPLPYFLEAQLSANLQLLSSQLGVYVIRWCQIPVYLEGNIIDLGSYKLQVVEACSGLRYLFPLMSLGFICAYLYDAAIWKRAVVFLSTIPITLLMNSFRIGMIGILVDNWGIAMAEGFIHDFEGWAVFMACLGLLILEMILLTKLTGDRRSFFQVFGFAAEFTPLVDELVYETRPLSKPLLVIVAVIAVVGLVLQGVDKREEVIPARKAFVDFPEQIANWSGHQEALESNVINALKLTDYGMVNYALDNRAINFYAAYYATQRKGVSPHSPSVCIPGGGWQIAQLDRHVWDGLAFNRILIKKGDAKQVVYYWFQQRGRMIANEYLMKWYLFTDAVLLNRTDGALVRLTTTVYPGEQEQDADLRLKTFMKQLMPVLPDYLPN